MIRPRPLSVAALAALAIAAASLAEPIRAVRGLATHADVTYGPRLRSKADQSPSSPVMVRVSSAADSKDAATQRIEFIGAVVGTYDLRDFVEREDGRPVADLPPLPITVVSHLPADAGTDLYSSGSSWFNWAAHYRAILWTAVAFWCAVPVAALVVRRLRRPPPVVPAAPPPPPPTIEEQLIAAIAQSASEGVSIDDLARLELLVFRYLGGSNADAAANPEEVVAVFQRARASDDTRDVVASLERWLHARDGEHSRDAAARALEDLRRVRIQPALAARPVLAGGAA